MADAYAGELRARHGALAFGPSMHLQPEQAARGGSALFTKGPTGVIKSVLDTTRTDGGRRDEIFVDIVEKLTCTFNSSGYLQASQIDGAIVVGAPAARALLERTRRLCRAWHSARHRLKRGFAGQLHASTADLLYLQSACSLWEAMHAWAAPITAAALLASR